MGTKCRRCIEHLIIAISKLWEDQTGETISEIREMEKEGCIPHGTAEGSISLIDKISKEYWTRAILFDYADSISKVCQREKE